LEKRDHIVVLMFENRSFDGDRSYPIHRLSRKAA